MGEESDSDSDSSSSRRATLIPPPLVLRVRPVDGLRRARKTLRHFDYTVSFGPEELQWLRLSDELVVTDVSELQVCSLNVCVCVCVVTGFRFLSRPCQHLLTSVLTPSSLLIHSYL
jgi:hypothetical protein